MSSLSGLEKWSYAIGNMPFSLKDAAFINFVVFYYTQVQGLSGTLTGLAMFIALIWDAISDPVVGSWSDTLRSRWGRRHPLLIAGGIPTVLLFLALFQPPQNLTEMGVFAWLLGVSILLRTCLTIYFIPYSAMGAELSSDYDERTVIAKARVTMGWLIGMAVPAFGFAIIFQTENGIDGRLIAANYVDYGILSAVLAGVATVICVWGTWSVIPRLPQSSQGDEPFSFIQPFRDAKVAFGNNNFRLCMFAALAFGMSAGIYTTLSIYLGTYFWEFSADQLAGLVVPIALATLVAFVVLGRLGQRYEKPSMMAAASIVLAFNTVVILGARLIGVLPENGHPAIYTLVLLSTGIGVFAIVMLQVATASLLADILDEHELLTGRRQEGVFFAAGAFVLKATTGLGALVAGMIIDLVGLVPGSTPGLVAQPVLQSLGWFTLILTSSMALIAFLFYRRIHMTREDHLSVKTQLEAR